ncbi:MAG TPA: hypothetical protein VGI73_14265 [Solirubrobacterales bacterium]
MEPGNWIALGAVAVGLVGNGVTWKLANRRFDHEKKLADRDAVAKIFDEAVIDIHRVSYVLDEIRAGLRAQPESYFHADAGTRVLTELETRGRDLELRADRARLRLETDLPWGALDSLAQNALAAFRACIQLREEDVPEPEYRTEEWRDWVRGQRAEVEKQRSIFYENLRVFRRYAFQAVGIEPVRKITPDDGPGKGHLGEWGTTTGEDKLA